MAMDLPDDLGLMVAQQVRRMRLARHWSREELAERCGINVYTLKHFERYGNISLQRLLKICQKLDILDELIRAFKPRRRVDVDEWSVPNAQRRQRGRRHAKVQIEEPLEV